MNGFIINKFMEIIFTLFIIFFLDTGICQATISDLPTMNRTFIMQKIAEEEKAAGPLLINTGEILEAGEKRITLLNSEGVKKEYLIDNTAVYLNGLPSGGGALGPISPGRYFQGCLYLDTKGKVRILEAWYIGGEAQVVAVEYVRECANIDKHYFSLTIMGLDTGKVGEFMVNERLNDIIKTLKSGTCIYYLLNTTGEISYISELQY